jgi:curved DNA-binding protein CbpA
LPKPPTHYLLLGEPPAATVEALHAAYLILAFQIHPDRAPEDKKKEFEEKFKALGLAWGVLKNKEFRKRYDAELKLLGLNCSSCNGTGLVWRSVGFTRREESRCPACRGTGRNDLKEVSHEVE